MVPDSTRQLVRQRAQFLCEYCHSPEAISPDRFTLDHIQPRSKNGTDDLNNLALACHRCNERRSNATQSRDPQTEAVVSLFNPRQHPWRDHFIWSTGGTEILGQSAIGRATCDRLDLNDHRYPLPDSIRKVRQIWVKAGWHPPTEDPIQQLTDRLTLLEDQALGQLAEHALQNSSMAGSQRFVAELEQLAALDNQDP